MIIGSQFRDLKFGDRFYYENGHDKATRFELSQLSEIKKNTMARVICDNLDLINIIQKKAFLPTNKLDNQFVKCATLKKMDMTKWKNERLL